MGKNRINGKFEKNSGSGTFEHWYGIFPLRRIESREKLAEAKLVRKRILDCDAVCYQGANDFFKTLTVLIVESENYFLEQDEESPKATENLAEFLIAETRTVIQEAESVLPSFEFRQFLQAITEEAENRRMEEAA